MRLQSIFFVLSIATVSVPAQSSSYCDSKLCKGIPNIHIACPGVAVNLCPSDAKTVNMKKYEDLIVDQINEYRNDLASGKYPHLPVPARLAEVKWDDDLAEIATIHAEQCYFAHDICHNTKKYPYSGQNLYRSSGYRDARKCIKMALESWWNELYDTTESHIESYPTIPPQKVIGHFTVMANEKSVRIGCAAVQANDRRDCYVTCNFSWTNMLSLPVYSKGEAGSKCKKGASKNYPALCKGNEPIDHKRPIIL